MNTITYKQWSKYELQKSTPFRQTLISNISHLEKEEIIKIILAEKFCEKIGMTLSQKSNLDNSLISELKKELKAQKNQHTSFTIDLVLAYISYINKQYDSSIKLLGSCKNTCQEMVKKGFLHYNLRELIIYINQFHIFFHLNERNHYLYIEKSILEKLNITETNQENSHPILFIQDNYDTNRVFMYAFCIYTSISKIIKNYNDRSEINRFANQIHINLKHYSEKVFQDFHSLIEILKQLSHITKEEFNYLSKKHMAKSSTYFNGMLENILTHLNQKQYWETI